MKMNKIIAGTSAAVLSLTVAGVAMAANQNTNIQLNVEVQETLSLDCYDIAGGTGDQIVDMGIVTAGTPVLGASRCNVVTNDDQGYYLTTENASTAGSTGDVLEHEDPNNAGTWYSIADKTAFDYSAPVTATYSGTGLGFSVNAIPASESNTANDNWVVDSCGGGNEEYAGIPDTAEIISAVVSYQSSVTTTDVCYQLDVPATQQSGNYSGSITYTVTTDASTI